jgi:hypothetical protein
LTDYAAEPKRRDPGEGSGGRTQDEYRFLFPSLVEIAVSESRSDLLADLRAWISDQTWVQAAIGIKIYTRRGSALDGRMEAIVYRRRNVHNLNPSHVVQLYPATEHPLVLNIWSVSGSHQLPPHHKSAAPPTRIGRAADLQRPRRRLASAAPPTRAAASRAGPDPILSNRYAPVRLGR